MGRRGRRQVLQLDDVSSSHQSRRYAFQPQQVEDKSNQLVPNSLRNLVGAYNSDSDEDEEEQNEEEIHEGTRQELPPLPPTLPAEPPAMGSAVEKASAVKADGSLDLEVASFLAEIESISTEQTQTVGNDRDDDVTSTYLSKPDMGFMIKPDASAAAFSKPDEAFKKPKPASSNAYKSMFVKGESEFVRPEDEAGKGGKRDEDEEELPEEPLSEWQIVQDEATQYYYYWNMVTNEVTWEIPPGYTQFLLRYKEYEERIAKIPKDKLQRLREKAERKMKDQAGKEPQQLSASSSFQSNSTTKDSSTHSSSDHRSSKSSKHSKHSETNGSSDHVSSSREKKKNRVEFGPSLPPPEFRGGEVEPTVKTVNENGNMDYVTDGRTDVSVVPYEVNADETDTVSSTTILPPQPEDESGTSHASNPATSSATPLDMLNADAIINEVLMPIEEEIVQPNGDTEESEEPMSVLETSEEKAEEQVEEDHEEEDDFDMDFDDIDDLDRALEKALEKKLEKKKAELLKLEEKSSALAARESVDKPLSPQPCDAQPAELSHNVDQIKSDQAKSSGSTPNHESDLVQPALPDHKTDEVPSILPTETAEREPSPVEFDRSSESVSEVNADKTEALEPPVLKRSAEGEAGKSDQEPDEKRARLVAYDVPESDEESVDVIADQVNMPPPPDRMPGVLSETDFSDVLPTPPPEQADNLAELQSMADTAQDKLAFLEVTTKGLTPLQITLIQLQTRLKDWQEGGLNAEYFFQRMSEVNGLLEQYETAAVPPGWACHWDRNFRRYFYTHEQTGESQWDYPDKNGDPAPADREEPTSTRMRKKSKRSKKSSRRKAKVTVEDSEDGMSKDGEIASGSMVTEDIDGAAMLEEDLTQFEQQQLVEGSNIEPAEPDTTAPLTIESAEAAYQALFPGEPLPPGTELLFGLPPPPPPSFPPPDEKREIDNYVCDDDDSSSEKGEDGEAEKDGVVDSVVVSEPVTVLNEKSERFEPEDMEVSQGGDSWSGGSLETHEPPNEPGVIAKPPQLRFTNLHPSSTISSSSVWLPGVSGEGNRAVGADTAVLAAPPVLTASTHLHPEVMAKVTVSVSGTDVSSAPGSPKVEDGVRGAGSPAPVEASTASDHKHEKHKKKKKEKIGSSGLSLKKKGVSSLVQKWQKVKREVEQEERANEKRQMAIRQQLEEWKKDNN